LYLGNFASEMVFLIQEPSDPEFFLAVLLTKTGFCMIYSYTTTWRKEKRWCEMFTRKLNAEIENFVLGVEIIQIHLLH
jgi:hypothetical protein